MRASPSFQSPLARHGVALEHLRLGLGVSTPGAAGNLQSLVGQRYALVHIPTHRDGLEDFHHFQRRMSGRFGLTLQQPHRSGPPSVGHRLSKPPSRQIGEEDGHSRRINRHVGACITVEGPLQSVDRLVGVTRPPGGIGE